MKKRSLRKQLRLRVSRGEMPGRIKKLKKRDGARAGCIARYAGVTLLEMMVGISMFMILMIVAFAVFNMFLKNWRAAEARDEVHRTFLRFSYNIEKEMIKSDIETVRCGIDKDKGWIAFKTNIDMNGNPSCDNKGYPVWKRCIIYYTIRPAEDSCSPSATDRDMICPHKFLIRKDINDPNAVNSDADVKRFLTFTLTAGDAKSEGNILLVKPVGTNVLELNGKKDATHVYVKLSVLRIIEAQKQIGIGSTPLDSEIAKNFVNRFIWCSQPQNKEI